MSLTADTTALLAATAIMLILSFSVVSFASILMRNLAVILTLFDIDVGDD